MFGKRKPRHGDKVVDSRTYTKQKGTRFVEAALPVACRPSQNLNMTEVAFSEKNIHQTNKDLGKRRSHENVRFVSWRQRTLQVAVETGTENSSKNEAEWIQVSV
jgi:hypothetical protein